MSDDAETIRTSLRLPKTLYDKIAKAAQGRTMHAEIIQRLEASFEVEAAKSSIQEAFEDMSAVASNFAAMTKSWQARFDFIMQEVGGLSPDALRRMNEAGLRAEREFISWRKDPEADQERLDFALKRIKQQEGRLDKEDPSND